MSVDTESRSVPAPPPMPRECGICQSAIQPQEQTHACPSCGLSFHIECWEENRGCSAYGCKQVNALSPDVPHKTPDAAAPDAADEPGDDERPFPWDHLILGVCTIAMIFSGLTFGVPSMLALLALITRFNFRDRIDADMHPGLLGASAAACVMGIIGGWMISSFWWLRG